MFSFALIAVWGGLLGAASMLIYGKLSPQQRIAALTQQIRATQSELARSSDSELAAIWPTTKRALGLSLVQIRLMLLPTLAAGSLVLGAAWLADAVFDFSQVAVAPAGRFAWLLTGHAAFWGTLSLAAIGAKQFLHIH